MAAPASVEIQGTCDAAFGAVREAFERNFAEHGDVGAAVAVVVDGEPVVDLWAGHADKARTRPWQRETIVNVYSTTKGMLATCAHMLADRGLLDFDAPVTEYWPEFGQAGKDGIPVRYLLTHQAGLPVVDKELPPGSSLDWDVMVEALAVQAPVWTPGEKQGYHAVTFGWLVGEVVRRISGRSVGTFFREEVAQPLDIDFFIGTPASEDHRIAEMIRAAPPPGGQQPQGGPFGDPNSLPARAMQLAGSPAAADVNSREWRAAEVPAANGHGNARALARVYGALARGGEIGGVRLLGEAAIERATAEQVAGHDEILPLPTRRSLGFMLPLPERGDARGPKAFGHSGAGGSMGYADPETKVGFGYTMNQMRSGATGSLDPRGQGLVQAVNASL